MATPQVTRALKYSYFPTLPIYQERSRLQQLGQIWYCIAKLLELISNVTYQ